MFGVHTFLKPSEASVAEPAKQAANYLTSTIFQPAGKQVRYYSCSMLSDLYIYIVNIFSVCYYIKYMFPYLLTKQKFNSFGCHGNQGVNPCIIDVLKIYRRHQA